jgi:hypothetical protein
MDRVPPTPARTTRVGKGRQSCWNSTLRSASIKALNSAATCLRPLYPKLDPLSESFGVIRYETGSQRIAISSPDLRRQVTQYDSNEG